MPKGMPWDKWFFEDLDRDCGVLSLKARGGWVWIIGDLREHEGERSLTLEGWAKVMRCTIPEAAEVLAELVAEKVCDCPEGARYFSVTGNAEVTKSNGENNAKVTVRCRRIYRESKDRRENRLRQERFKARRRGNAEVTGDKRESNAVRSKKQEAKRQESPISPYENNGNGNGNGHLPLDSMAMILFDSYPAHRRGDRIEIERALAELCPDKDLFSRIISSLDVLKQSDSWKEHQGKFVPNVCKFIAGRQWEQVKLPDPICQTCDQSGIICRDGDKILPWTVEREVNQGLPFEVCPDCRGKNRISIPGAPIVRFP
jgi:hypothetical protein